MEDQALESRPIRERSFNLKTILFFFFAIIVSDHFLKMIVSEAEITFTSNFISIFNWEDDNFFLSLSTAIPKDVTQFFSALIAFYLFALYACFIYFLKNKDLFYIKVGITTIFFAIISNALERAMYATTSLIFHTKFLGITSFNYADLAILAGFFFLLFGTCYHWKELIGSDNRRKTFLINPEYQLRTSAFVVFALFLFAITIGSFSFIYFNNHIFSFHLNQENIIILSYFLGLAIIVGIFSLILFLAVVIYTQKTVGPLVALERYIDEVFDNPEAKLKLRDGDHLIDLYKISEKIETGILKIKTESD